jgi:hypothetical protein
MGYSLPELPLLPFHYPFELPCRHTLRFAWLLTDVLARGKQHVLRSVLKLQSNRPALGLLKQLDFVVYKIPAANVSDRWRLVGAGTECGYVGCH